MDNTRLTTSNEGVATVLDAVRRYGSRIEAYKELGPVHVDCADEFLIFNYTAECMYARLWTPVTRVCRGLIVHWPSATLAARPFDKFFSLGEMPETMPDALPLGPYEVTLKLDGSLGICYRARDGFAVSTRGRLTGRQSLIATALLRQDEHHLERLPPDLTPLFEIIYPENRIVLDYGDQRALILIGARRFDGYDFNHDELLALGEAHNFSVVPRMAFGTLVEVLADLEARSELMEGFVMRAPDGLRVKVKTEEYMRLSRLIGNLTPSAILAAMQANALETVISALPEAFARKAARIVDVINAYVDSEALRLHKVYARVKQQAVQENSPEARKAFALAATRMAKADTTYLFALYDGRPIRPMLLKRLDLTRLFNNPSTTDFTER